MCIGAFFSRKKVEVWANDPKSESLKTESQLTACYMGLSLETAWKLQLVMVQLPEHMTSVIASFLQGSMQGTDCDL